MWTILSEAYRTSACQAEGFLGHCHCLSNICSCCVGHEITSMENRENKAGKTGFQHKKLKNVYKYIFEHFNYFLLSYFNKMFHCILFNFVVSILFRLCSSLFFTSYSACYDLFFSIYFEFIFFILFTFLFRISTTDEQKVLNHVTKNKLQTENLAAAPTPITGSRYTWPFLIGARHLPVPVS